jgi:hypothetical protein
MPAQHLASMSPEEQQRWRQQFRGYAGLGVPSLAGGASMAAMGVPGVNVALGTALGLMPNTMGDQGNDPNYRQSIQEEARTGAHGMPQRIRNQWAMQPTQPSAAPPSSPMGVQTGGQGMGGLAQLLQSLMGR